MTKTKNMLLLHQHLFVKEFYKYLYTFIFVFVCLFIRACTKKKNIVFLKTHKTGSSTVTNILNRYGEAHELNFVLPKVGSNRLDWPWFFKNTSYHPLQNIEPNILCNHARFNRTSMGELMPNDTVYVTILRNPISQFESSFSYMTFDKILGMQASGDALTEFFKDPESILVNYVLTQDLRINSDRLKLIQNGMLYDLGLESKDFSNKKKIMEKLYQLDSQFHLVMIMEYFEESIVLLKRLLCWELDDVTYFRLKHRAHSWRRRITKPLEEKIRNWSRADVVLYEHFNRTFWNILKHIDQDFWEEVEMLKAKNNFINNLCVQQDKNEHTIDLPDSAETKTIHIRHDIPFAVRKMCKRMTWDEIKYLKHLREIQIEKTSKTKRLSDELTFTKTFLNSFSWMANKFYKSYNNMLQKQGKLAMYESMVKI